MQITDSWLRDLPQQFQEKKKIEILIKALSRQLEEVEAVFSDVNTMTDIDIACGQNLDYVGDIVCMSRKDAGELIKKRFQEPVISDERYREYLKYQILRNTSDCTYQDIMQAIDLLWDVKKAHYYEKAERPATIFIGLPAVGIEEEDQAKGKPTILKPGGVGFIYAAQYGTEFNHVGLERIVFVNLDLHFRFRFFGLRLLNGEWLLDGSVNLNQRAIHNFNIFEPRRLNGEWLLDGIAKLNQKFLHTMGMGLTIQEIWIHQNEYFSDCFADFIVKMNHSAWERVVAEHLDLHFCFRFFGLRLLNVEWLLDGSASLNQKARCNFNRWETRFLDGAWPLDGLAKLNQKAIHTMRMGIDFGVVKLHPGGQVKDGFVTMRKDLWYLAGEEVLDGTRLLDAEIRKESI